MSESQLFAEAVLGKDAEEFISSDLGRYLVGCAEQERIEAIDKLKSTASWRRRRIQELQNIIWRAENFSVWLTEMVNNGQQALAALEDR